MTYGQSMAQLYAGQVLAHLFHQNSPFNIRKTYAHYRLIRFSTSRLQSSGSNTTTCMCVNILHPILLSGTVYISKVCTWLQKGIIPTAVQSSTIPLHHCILWRLELLYNYCKAAIANLHGQKGFLCSSR